MNELLGAFIPFSFIQLSRNAHIYIAPRLGLGFGLGLRFRLGFRGGRFFSWAAVPEPAEGGRPEVFCKKKSS